MQLKNDGDDVTFTGFSIKFEDLSFENSKQSAFGKSNVFLYKIDEYERRNCSIPTKKKCFPKCILVLPGKHSEKDYIEFNNNFGRKRTVINEATVKSFCRKVGRDIENINGKKV